MAGIGSCATASMLQTEVVILEPVKKTISVWTWHNSTVRDLKRSIEDQEGIFQDVQRLVHPAKGIMNDEEKMGHLWDFHGRFRHVGPPRLILKEAADSEVLEPDAEPDAEPS